MAAAGDDSKSIQEILSYPILFADRVIKSAREAESFETENSELARQVTDLSQSLRSAVRLTSSSAVYDRPIRRVSVDVTKTLDRALALALARKCRFKRTNVLHHVLSITAAADFKKLSNLLDSSLADIKWVLSILDHDDDDEIGAVHLSLSPFVTTNPILAWVWQCIAAVHAGRPEAARYLASLALDNDRTKKIIVEENAIPPLLKMLKDGATVDAQSASAAALCNLADDPARVKAIAEASGVQIIVKSLSEVPMPVQLTLVNLISMMLEAVDVDGREEFGKENVTRPLVALLGMDIVLDIDFKAESSDTPQPIHSLYSIVQMNRDKIKNDRAIEAGNQNPNSHELKSMLKVSSAIALSKLAHDSPSNSKKITETKALLVLAKIIETESDQLKTNCLNVIVELAVVAERDSDLKRTSFKPSSPAAKAILDQLLRVINEDTNPTAATLAIKAVGCLSSMFSAKEKRIVESLVTQLSRRNLEVASEAAKALCKFARDENYNHKEHSRAIIEHDGVRKITNLMRRKDRGNLHELVLLCHLATNVGNSKALEQARALSVLLEEAARHTVAQNPALRELFTKAIHQLSIYQEAGSAHVNGRVHVHGQV